MPVGIRSLQIGITDCHDQCAHWSRNDRGRTKQLDKLGFYIFSIVAQMRQECHRKFLDSIHWA